MAPHGSQPFEAVDLDARMLRFWDATGAPIALVQYALMLHDTATTTSPVETVSMGLWLTGDGSGTKDSSWTQATGPSADHPGDRFARGFAVVALGPGTTSWYLTLGAVGSVTPRRGGVASDGGAAGRIDRGLDLALAGDGDESADRWQFGEQSVPRSGTPASSTASGAGAHCLPG